MTPRFLTAVPALFLLGLASVAIADPQGPCIEPSREPNLSDLAKDVNAALDTVNSAAPDSVFYEVQVRAANACDPAVGTDAEKKACLDKIAPTVHYNAEGMRCEHLDELQRIKLGTLDDLREKTTDPSKGITIDYVKQKVGANTLWLMPIFPNNDRWSIPDACDNLGSPYAVRDYMHASGSLSRNCIQSGRDENSAEPCWGNDSLDKVIADAHAKGMKVILDVALNHFGHNYQMYDIAGVTHVRDRIANGEKLDSLWDFARTYDEGLVHPKLLDTAAGLAKDPTAKKDLALLKAKCPALAGDALVRNFNAWRDALDWERKSFPCDSAGLEFTDPGFYLGANHFDPSSKLGDNFSNNWRDVKFLYHHEENVAHEHELAREREYLFRIMNYWSSRGVDGFRLDHTTDGDGGMAPNEWKYLTSKVDFYAKLRGQDRPIYLAEEFGDQQGMSKVVDVMTEGYVGDMNGRHGVTKDAAHVENVVKNINRFHGRTSVMTGLETHDEKRLTDETGFDSWTGAGFWGVGATTWSTPMILMGQEFGETNGLGFRKSDFLRSRFDGKPNTELTSFYKKMIDARMDPKNVALRSSSSAFLRRREDNGTDPRIFAQVKYGAGGAPVFTFNNLWKKNVAQSYYLPPALASTLGVEDGKRYKLVDAITGKQVGPTHSGADLKWDLHVEMDADTRLQWLRLEPAE